MKSALITAITFVCFTFLVAADPQVDAVMKAHEDGIAKLKADTIKKLKDILDKKMTAKDLDGANNVKKVIASLENKKGDDGDDEGGKSEDGKVNEKDQLGLLGEPSLPKGAKLVKVSATSYEGTEIGKFNKGDKIEVGYVSGEWSGNSAKPISPNKVEGSYTKCVIISTDKTGNHNLLATVPLNTDAQPFLYKFESSAGKVSLRISKSLNNKNDFADNSGEATYWFRKVK